MWLCVLVIAPSPSSTTQDTEPSVVINMSSSEFQRITRDLSQFGDSISISCNKEGVTFSSTGVTEGTAKITLKPTVNTDEKKGDSVSPRTQYVQFKLYLYASH